MQMFITDPDFRICAEHLDDKRLNKIIIESAQIASTALWINNCFLAEKMYSQREIYLPTHEHHPLCQWAAKKGNMRTVIHYGAVLCDEYIYRFHKIHTTLDIFWNLFMSVDFCNTSPEYINCTTHHKHIENVYEAYRKELTLKWDNDKIPPKWTKRNKPYFYKEVAR